jgi:putative ABC transport system permease protein
MGAHVTPFRLATLSLLRRPLSTLIAIVSIAISVACSGILLKLYLLSGSRFDSMGRGGQAIVGAKAGGIEILLGSLNGEGEYPGFFPDKLFLSLRHQAPVTFEDGVISKPNFVRSVIPILYFGKFHEFRAIGTDESFFHRPDAGDSLPFTQGGEAQTDSEIALGSEVAQSESLKVGDTLSVKDWVSEAPSFTATEFKVSGILAPTSTVWDRSLFARISIAQKIVAKSPLGERSIWGPQVLNYFLAYLEPGGFAQLSSLINKRTVAQAVVVETEKARLENLTGTGRKLGMVIVVFVLVLGGLSIAGLMLTRFEAMSLQIAVLRAIGYSNSEVGRWLLLEGLLLGLVACVIGAVLDASLFPLIREALGQALPNEMVKPLSLFSSSPVWLASLFATVLAVLIPLGRVVRQDVHSSLRGL